MKSIHKSLIAAGVLLAVLGCQSQVTADYNYNLDSAPQAQFIEGESQAKKLYEQGQQAMNNSQWRKAAEHFNELAVLDTKHQAAAQYWHAYALYRAGNNASSVRSLNKLIKNHPNSEWAEQARSLRAQMTGVADAVDDDLKLYAIQSLMNVSAERAIPILKKTLTSDNTEQVKEAALFVLSQKRIPQARAVIVELAKNGSDAKLQRNAIEMLAISRDAESLKVLGNLYETLEDPELREDILEGFMIARDAQTLIRVANIEQDPNLREHAIEMLGVMQEKAALNQLYKKERNQALRHKIVEALMIARDEQIINEILNNETDPKLVINAIHMAASFRIEGIDKKLSETYKRSNDMKIKQAIIESYMIARNIDALTQLLATETNPKLIDDIIEMLAMSRTDNAMQALEAHYTKSSDVVIKKKIIEAFMISGNAKKLISVFRTETNPELKKSAIEHLSMMKSDEAQALMLEILEQD